MKLASTIARYLLGLIFVVFSLNFWLQFMPIPMPPEGSNAANFMGAIFMSGFLTVVKVMELIGGLLLLSGRFVNLALAILGPVVINIALYHVVILGAGYEMAVVLSVLALLALLGRKDFLKVLTASK
tara:strand:+ start:111 stop:491 length:381 start_codon:yes stop_codon:yes gene_type:complete